MGGTAWCCPASHLSLCCPVWRICGRYGLPGSGVRAVQGTSSIGWRTGGLRPHHVPGGDQGGHQLSAPHLGQLVLGAQLAATARAQGLAAAGQQLVLCAACAVRTMHAKTLTWHVTPGRRLLHGPWHSRRSAEQHRAAAVPIPDLLERDETGCAAHHAGTHPSLCYLAAPPAARCRPANACAWAADLQPSGARCRAARCARRWSGARNTLPC